MIKILTDCANEKGVLPELVKQIYDIERGEVHQNIRMNEVVLRDAISKSFKEK